MGWVGSLRLPGVLLTLRVGNRLIMFLLQKSGNILPSQGFNFPVNQYESEGNGLVRSEIGLHIWVYHRLQVRLIVRRPCLISNNNYFKFPFSVLLF